MAGNGYPVSAAAGDVNAVRTLDARASSARRDVALPFPHRQAEPVSNAAVLYLHGIFQGLGEERLHVVFYDRYDRYVHDRTLVIGCAGSMCLKGRLLLQEAFARQAHGIVLAHNHLSGVCRPSAADIESTRRLSALCSQVDITLIDHLIFTRDRGFSMRLGGYL
ncbi:hypothetical protein MTsPCn7_17000 [Altererythrobacter sp. MTPC7]